MNRIYHYTEVDSTNDCLHRMQPSEAPDRTLVWADYQTAGRGRRGRHFDMDPGQSIAMSILMRPGDRLLLNNASRLTPVMALAVLRALQYVCPSGEQNAFGIKWPNDVLFHGKKVCGILTELFPAPDGSIDHLIIGTGINVNQEHFSEELPYAGSLRMLTGKEYDREPIVKRVCEEFEKLYEDFLVGQNLASMREEYEAVLVNRGCEVRVLDPQGEWTGTALGITEDGALRVQRKDGVVMHVDSGEVSVRGIYGYI